MEKHTMRRNAGGGGPPFLPTARRKARFQAMNRAAAVV